MISLLKSKVAICRISGSQYVPGKTHALSQQWCALIARFKKDQLNAHHKWILHPIWGSQHLSPHNQDGKLCGSSWKKEERWHSWWKSRGHRKRATAMIHSNSTPYRWIINNSMIPRDKVNIIVQFNVNQQTSLHYTTTSTSSLFKRNNTPTVTVIRWVSNRQGWQRALQEKETWRQCQLRFQPRATALTTN